MITTKRFREFSRTSAGTAYMRETPESSSQIFRKILKGAVMMAAFNKDSRRRLVTRSKIVAAWKKL